MTFVTKIVVDVRKYQTAAADHRQKDTLGKACSRHVRIHTVLFVRELEEHWLCCVLTSNVVLWLRPERIL